MRTKFKFLEVTLLLVSISTLFTNAHSAITSEDASFSHVGNAVFLWAVDPTDMSFDVGTSDFSALSGWGLDIDPYGVTENGAWVLTAPV